MGRHFVRQRYINELEFLDPVATQEDVYLRTTDTDRTYESAIA